MVGGLVCLSFDGRRSLATLFSIVLKLKPIKSNFQLLGGSLFLFNLTSDLVELGRHLSLILLLQNELLLKFLVLLLERLQIVVDLFDFLLLRHEDGNLLFVLVLDVGDLLPCHDAGFQELPVVLGSVRCDVAQVDGLL